MKTGIAAFLFLACGFLNSCGNTTHPGLRSASNECVAGFAQIGVGDVYLDRMCGCREAAGSFSDSQVLECTITHGESVVFLFTSKKLKHQIIPAGTPALAGSGISNPKDVSPLRSYLLRFDTVGTYTFQDTFYPTLTGKIIVQ